MRPRRRSVRVKLRQEVVWELMDRLTVENPAGSSIWTLIILPGNGKAPATGLMYNHQRRPRYVSSTGTQEEPTA